MTTYDNHSMRLGRGHGISCLLSPLVAGHCGTMRDSSAIFGYNMLQPSSSPLSNEPRSPNRLSVEKRIPFYTFRLGESCKTIYIFNGKPWKAYRVPETVPGPGKNRPVAQNRFWAPNRLSVGKRIPFYTFRLGENCETIYVFNGKPIGDLKWCWGLTWPNKNRFRHKTSCAKPVSGPQYAFRWKTYTVLHFSPRRKE